MTEPQLTIIAGPNGSGKSTLTNLGQLSGYGLSLPSHYINPDDIAREIVDVDIPRRDREAWRRARDQRREYREQSVSFAFETVFSHPSTLLDMRACREAGYTISLLFVTTSNVEINVARVAGRVRHGGHDVPEDKIRERYERSLTLLPRAIEEANRAFVFDTSQDAEPRLCYRKGLFSLALDCPPYLQNRLIDILRRRSEERDEIMQLVGPIHWPNEQDGSYAGPICEAREFYIVQQTAEGNLVLHDRLVLSGCGLDTTYIHYRSGEGVAS